MLYSISELSVPFATPLWSATVIFFSLPVFSVKLPTVILVAVVVISYWPVPGVPVFATGVSWVAPL